MIMRGYARDSETGEYKQDDRGNMIPNTVNGYYIYGVIAKGDAKGNTKLSVRFCDGTNKTVSMTIKVK